MKFIPKEIDDQLERVDNAGQSVEGCASKMPPQLVLFVHEVRELIRLIRK